MKVEDALLFVMLMVLELELLPLVMLVVLELSRLVLSSVLVMFIVLVMLIIVVALVLVVVLMSTKEAMMRSTCPPGVTYGNPKHSPTTQQT